MTEKFTQNFVPLFCIILVFTLKFGDIVAKNSNEVVKKVQELFGIYPVSVLHAKLSKTRSDIKGRESFGINRTYFILNLIIIEQIRVIQIKEEL